jgi:hypothetical protein
MKNYTLLFSRLNDELEQIPGMQLKDFFYSEEAPEDLLNSIEADFSIKLDAPARAFYTQCNGMKIHWEYQGEQTAGETISGRIRFLDIEKIFYGPNRKNWESDTWTNDMNEDEKKMRKMLKPFDYFDPDDSGCSCFDIETGIVGKNIVLHSVDYGLSSMKCDFEKYLDLVFKTRGYYRWQFLYSNLIPPRLESYNKQTIENLKILFNVKPGELK